MCVTKTMILLRTHHNTENISGGFPTSSDNASFIIRPACVDICEQCDARVYVCDRSARPSVVEIAAPECVENTDGCCFCFFRQTYVTFYTKITGRSLIPRTPPPKKQQGLAAQTDHFLPSSCPIEQYQQPALRPPLCVSTRLLFWNN